jgi:hypothetical protein
MLEAGNPGSALTSTHGPPVPVTAVTAPGVAYLWTALRRWGKRPLTTW